MKEWRPQPLIGAFPFCCSFSLSSSLSLAKTERGEGERQKHRKKHKERECEVEGGEREHIPNQKNAFRQGAVLGFRENSRFAEARRRTKQRKTSNNARTATNPVRLSVPSLSLRKRADKRDGDKARERERGRERNRQEQTRQ